MCTRAVIHDFYPLICAVLEGYLYNKLHIGCLMVNHLVGTMNQKIIVFIM